MIGRKFASLTSAYLRASSFNSQHQTIYKLAVVKWECVLYIELMEEFLLYVVLFQFLRAVSKQNLLPCQS